MKALKYVVSVVSAFLLLSMSALAADGVVTIVPDFTYYLHRVGFRQSSGQYYYISNPSYVGGKGNASLLTDYSIPERTFSNPILMFQIYSYDSPLVSSLTSGVKYTISLDYTWAGCTPSATLSNPIRLQIGDTHNYFSGYMYPTSSSVQVSGGSAVFEFAVSSDNLVQNLSNFRILFFDNGAAIPLLRFSVTNFQISYTPTTQSVIDEIAAQGNLIEGVINEQTGQITGKIDEVTDEILHGYDAPDFSGNRSTIDDYNNKEHELIVGTADGKIEMESINNNALSAITSHVGAFVSVAQMMNDFINGHWFTNGLFTISASVGLLAVLLGVGIFAVGRFSARQHSDARYEARRADRRRGRGR